MRRMPVLLFLYSHVVGSPRSSDGFRKQERVWIGNSSPELWA